MKKLLLTLIVALIAFNSFSQIKNVVYSTPFEEPVRGWYKVMQLSNGYTFYFNFNNEKGIEVSIYNPDKKSVGRKVLSSNVWDPKNMKNSTMEGIYEIAGQPVIFLQQVNDRQPELFRIQLNPENGTIVKQQKLSELPKVRSQASKYVITVTDEPGDFIVEKDPYSDAYAVVCYDPSSKESNKRIELTHYSVEAGEHKDITHSYYDAQNFKYTNYIGMVVSGDKAVHLAAYGYNTARSGGKDSRVIISRIRKGETAFTNVNLEFTDDFKETEGLMNYNPETGVIQLLTLTFLKSRSNTDYYFSMISYIDPESLQIIKKTKLTYDNINAYVNAKKIGEDEFNPIPANMILNNDNTTTILLEETAQYAINTSSTDVRFGRLGVITIDNAGVETDAYAIMKGQIATGHPLEKFYLAKRGKGLWSYVTKKGTTLYTPQDNRSFYSFDYVNTANNNIYIIYNDSRNNYNNGTVLADANKLQSIKNVSESVATYRKIKNGYNIESGYLFGRNANDDETAFCNVESAHFRKETGVYAALMVKRVKREKKAYIAWITLE